MNTTPLLRPRRAPRRRGVAGFTLIELLVTIAIGAILVAVAAPSMTSVFRANRVQGEAAALVSDMQVARTEAVKRGLTVTMCASANASTCSGTNNWQKGWIVFTDPAANQSFDASTDTLLTTRAAFKGTDTAVVSSVSVLASTRC